MKTATIPNASGPDLSVLVARMREDPDVLDRALDASSHETTSLYRRMAGKETGLDNGAAALASEAAVAVVVSGLTAAKVSAVLASPRGRQVIKGLLRT
jgi:hypothetical protein